MFEVKRIETEMTYGIRHMVLIPYQTMEDCKYDTDKDDKIDLLLMQIAKWHNLIPKLWIDNYEASDIDINGTVKRITNTPNKDLFLVIAEDDEDNIQGFIWAYKQEKHQESVMILSLYTGEDYRGQGIATNFKKLLEEWCRLEGIKTIKTTVHYNNNSMIALNQKLGYAPGILYMTKRVYSN